MAQLRGVVKIRRVSRRMKVCVVSLDHRNVQWGEKGCMQVVTTHGRSMVEWGWCIGETVVLRGSSGVVGRCIR